MGGGKQALVQKWDLQSGKKFSVGGTPVTQVKKEGKKKEKEKKKGPALTSNFLK